MKLLEGNIFTGICLPTRVFIQLRVCLRPGLGGSVGGWGFFDSETPRCGGTIGSTHATGKHSCNQEKKSEFQFPLMYFNIYVS